jgi:signal transduction histidine kinase
VLRLPAGHAVEVAVAAQDPADADVAALVHALTGPAQVAAQQSVSLEAQLAGRHAVLVPLRAHLGDPAVLVVVHDRRSPEHDEERELLASFADHAGLALDRAEAVAGREELAVVSERARIARDLHDDVIQRLFAAGMRLEAYRATRPDAEGDALLAGVVDDLDRTIAAIRSTIFDLRGGSPA